MVYETQFNYGTKAHWIAKNLYVANRAMFTCMNDHFRIIENTHKSTLWTDNCEIIKHGGNMMIKRSYESVSLKDLYTYCHSHICFMW